MGKSDTSSKGSGHEFGGKKLKPGYYDVGRFVKRQFNRLTRRVGKKVIEKEIGQD